jgi:hypothetical protein
MTKQMFIHELRVSLASVNENVREEIIADINEHFTEGAKQGLSEEDICRGLGQPGTIAAQVLEELSSPKASPPREQKKYEYRYTPRTGQNIDKAFEEVNRITAKLEASNLHLLPSKDGMYRVVIRGGTGRERCNVENDNGHLRVSVKREKIIFGFFFGKTGTEVTIYVPAHYAGDIAVDSTAGNITATNTSGNLNLDTSAGNVTIDNHKCNIAKVDTSAGNVKMRIANEFIEYVNIDTSAGNIEFEAERTGDLKLDTSAGSIKARVNKLNGDTILDSSAGSINLTAHEVEGNIRLDSSAGSITAYLPENVNCRIDVRKPSVGSLQNNLTGNPHSPYVLRASSSVGSIRLKAM